MALWSRRSVLAAAATPLVAPLLWPRTAHAARPRRLVLFFVAEGHEATWWWPRTSSPEVAVPAEGYSLAESSLSCLEPLKRDLTIVRGVDHAATGRMRGCYHGFCMPFVLTGGPDGPPLTWGGVSTPGGVSIDRFLGRHVRGTAAFQTYELGVQTTRCDPIKQKLSYDGRDAGRYPQNDPFRAYVDLVGAPGLGAAEIARLHRRRMSVLDALHGQIAAARAAAEGEASRSLEAHLEGVRELERRFDRLHGRRRRAARLAPRMDAAWREARAHEEMARYPEVGRLQMDLAVAALAADLVRVVTIQWSHTVSRQLFPWLPVRERQGNFHDALSHNTSAAAVADRKIVYAWYAEQFRYLLERLRSIPDGDGTLLDGTAVVYLSEMSVGNDHSPRDIPLIVAGGRRLGLRTGRYLDLARHQRSRSFNDLWLTLAHAFGIGIDRFGEETYCRGPIPELLV